MATGFHPLPADPADFLANGPVVDRTHPDVIALADLLCAASSSPEEDARRCFTWVRDEIRHSWDAGDHAVSVSASETMRNGTGLCYAKAHLLAALLRHRGVPTALCYQRLAHHDGHVVHGLVAVHLDGRWHRQDPRGSTNGTTAEFSTDREILAWDADPAAGEVDYPRLFIEPAAEVVAALRAADRIDRALLPSELDAR